MDQILSENLFLLEFLVDKVNLAPGAIPREISDVTGETCVSFSFLDNDPLDICEEDFTPQRNYLNDSGNVKNGKSCLFAISPQQAKEVTYKFDVEVAIFKKLTNGVLPDKLQIGYATVPIAQTFSEILQLLQMKTESGTISRTLKESFPISGTHGENIGDIGVFVRISCFGKLIVTQFQMNLEEKSVFFKDKEGKSLYKYRKASKADSKSSSQRPSSQWSSSQPDQTKPSTQPQLKPAECDKWNDAIGGRPYPATEYSSTYDSGFCKECNEPAPAQQPAYPPCTLMQPPQPENKKACYQEIGAEMNGNALTIRVHKNKGLAVKRIDDDGSETQMTPEGCSCSIAAQPQNGRPAQQGRQAQNGSKATYQCSCLGELPYNAEASPPRAPCADKQVLSLKPADDPNNPFTFKMSGCANQARQNITVVPPTCTRPDGMQVTEISDPNKDVFILRIGKKSEGNDKKANLELELVTPKGIDKKPLPKKETRDTQYLESDVPDSDGGKGKGKGKGGKGGKGKKGKGKKGKKK